MALADERYMLLTTFRRDGTPVATPVWVTPYDEHSVAFWTSSGSGKAKRLALAAMPFTPGVKLAPSERLKRVSWAGPSSGGLRTSSGRRDRRAPDVLVHVAH